MTKVQTISIKAYAKKNNLTIVEATHNLRVRLTKADAQLGVRQNPANCGFARACTRRNQVEKAFFLRSTAFLQKGNKLVRYVLPKAMKNEILAFDRGGRMEPGVYNLTKPTPAQTVAAQSARDSRPRGSGPSGKRRRVVGIRTGIVVAA